MKPGRRELALLLAIVVVGALPLFGVPGFYSVANLRSLALDNLPALVTAIGMTVVIVAGQIDISVGSLFAVCGVVAGLAARAGLPMPGVVLVTLAAGAALGACNGVCVVLAGVPSIIATLATMAVFRNALIHATGGSWIQNLPPGFQWFGLGQRAAQPLYLLAGLAVFLASAWALRWTAPGRSFYAVGCDPEAARRLGLRPRGVTFAAFVLMGAFTALAALFDFTRYPSIATNAGLGFELDVIAAVVVGGTAITGGRGTLTGTLFGVVLLGMIGTVFTFLHANPAWKQAIEGAIILAAVVADTAWNKEAAHG